MKSRTGHIEPETSGFSGLDLLAVIAVIFFLALLLSPALARTRLTDQSFQCQNNLRQLMGAMLMYTHDYSDLFPPNPGTGPTTPGWDWCPGNPYDADSLKNPSHSLLVPYIGGKVELFHCPTDHGVGRLTQVPPGPLVPRVRDYCMNEAVGTDPSTSGLLPVNGASLALINGRPGNTRNGPWLTYGKTSSVIRPAPEALLVLLEVSPKSLNYAGFAVVMGLPLFQDCPGTFHNLGCAIAFADGHSELKAWQDARIAVWPNGEPYSNPVNPDVLWLQERTSALK